MWPISWPHDYINSIIQGAQCGNNYMYVTFPRYLKGNGNPSPWMAYHGIKPVYWLQSRFLECLYFIFQHPFRLSIETFSALVALCARNSPVSGEFPLQRPVTRSFDVFFDLRLNKRLSKQLRRRWFKTPSRSLWRHCSLNSTPCSQALAIGLKLRRSPVGNTLFSVLAMWFSWHGFSNFGRSKC